MKRNLLLTMLLAGALMPLAAAEPTVNFGVDGARFAWLVVPTGADVHWSLGPWRLLLGAGYEDPHRNRDEASGLPLDASQTKDYQDYPRFKQPNGQLGLRYTQPLGPVNLWGQSLVRGHWFLDAVPSTFRDRDKGLTAALATGLTWNGLTTDAHGVKSGGFAETFVEWGPAALSLQATDYLKAQWQSKWFVPLMDLPNPTNLFSIYGGARLGAQYINGAHVPIFLLEPTEVRGYYRQLDTIFRSVASLDLRFNLPSVYEAHSLMPIFIVFADAGWYYGYSDIAYSGSLMATKSGLLTSVGTGFALNVLDIVQPVLWLGLPLSDGEAGLWWRIDFNLRF